MNYTKGEWRASSVAKSGATISIQIGVGSCDWGIGDFSRVLPNNRKDADIEATHIANANLIAAAPNMYEALNAMIKAYEKLRKEKPLLFNMLIEADYKLYHVCEDACIKSEEALAKAEGEK